MKHASWSTSGVGLFAVVWGLLGICTGAESLPGVSDATQLKIIADGSLQNRQSFGFVTCKHKVIEGQSRDLRDAITNGVSKKGIEAEGIWIVNDKMVRHELVPNTAQLEAAVERAEAKAARSAMGEGKREVDLNEGPRFSPAKILWTGERGVSYSFLLNGGGFFPPGQAGPGVQVTPFDMVGMFGRDESLRPSRLIRQSVEGGDWKCQFEGVKGVDGVDMLVVTARSMDAVRHGEPNCMTFWFDPARNLLPMQMSLVFEDPKFQQTQVFVTKARACSGGRFFPERVVKILSGGARRDAGLLDVTEIVVTELDVDRPPSDAAFAIHLPKGARLHDPAIPNSQVALPQPRRVDLAALGKITAVLKTSSDEAEAA